MTEQIVGGAMLVAARLGEEVIHQYHSIQSSCFEYNINARSLSVT